MYEKCAYRRNGHRTHTILAHTDTHVCGSHTPGERQVCRGSAERLWGWGGPGLLLTCRMAIFLFNLRHSSSRRALGHGGVRHRQQCCRPGSQQSPPHRPSLQPYQEFPLGPPFSAHLSLCCPSAIPAQPCSPASLFLGRMCPLLARLPAPTLGGPILSSARQYWACKSSCLHSPPDHSPSPVQKTPLWSISLPHPRIKLLRPRPLLASLLGYFLAATSPATCPTLLGLPIRYAASLLLPHSPSTSGSIPRPTLPVSTPTAHTQGPHRRYPATWSTWDTFSWSLMTLRSL